MPREMPRSASVLLTPSLPRPSRPTTAPTRRRPVPKERFEAKQAALRAMPEVPRMEPDMPKAPIRTAPAVALAVEPKIELTSPAVKSEDFGEASTTAAKPSLPSRLGGFGSVIGGAKIGPAVSRSDAAGFGTAEMARAELPAAAIREVGFGRAGPERQFGRRPA
jgi:hypothetical protein